MNNFWSKSKLKQSDFFKKNLTFFSILNFFHVFLLKILNITSADQNKNMHILYKKNILKFNYIHLKLFFGGLVQTSQFFIIVMSS